MRQSPSASRCLSVFVLFVLSSAVALISSGFAQPSLLPARPQTIGRQLQRKLIQLQNHLDNQQWSEYGRLIVELLDEQSEGLVAVAGRRDEKLYVDFTEYCQQILTQAPAPAQDAYRRLVESRAEALYRQGLEALDDQLLQQVADNMQCSSWGDDALWALGELALTRGEYLAARRAWQKLTDSQAGLAHPDSSISPAEIAARLALVSIRAGEWKRAEHEIQELRRQYPQAQGTWGGRQIVFAEELPALLQRARQWPPLAVSDSWPTLGGSFQRTQFSPRAYADDLELAWQFPLLPRDSEPLHPPILTDHLVIVQDAGGINALDRETGQQVFLADGKSLQQPLVSLTSYRNHVIGATGQETWTIDTDREGALAFRMALDQPTERLIGDGVADGTHLLFELRSEDQFSRSGIACFDLATRKLEWKRWVVSANVGSAVLGTSLASSPGVVYLSTNLGATAAVRSADGRILWLRTYSRSVPDQPIAIASSCLLTGGTLVVAPTDSRQLLAIDPTSGQLVWTRSGIDPMAFLVGATGDRIVLYNDGLHVLDLGTGDVMASNFDVTPVGQCLLADETVYVPTPQGIDLYDLHSGQQMSESIPFPPRESINLLGAGECLLAAGQTELTMFKPRQDSQGTIDGQ